MPSHGATIYGELMGVIHTVYMSEMHFYLRVDESLVAVVLCIVLQLCFFFQSSDLFLEIIGSLSCLACRRMEGR